MTPYTLLRITECGIVLGDYHVRRFANADGFFECVRGCAPGIYSVHWTSGRFEVQKRPASRMNDGMSTRWAVSPMLHLYRPFPKPKASGSYQLVRMEGVATLLTTAEGDEILEACSAAVIGWDGSSLLVVPSDRPRVWSTAEAAIRDHLSVKECPLWTKEELPLLLVNAVKGTCTIHLPKRPPFPLKPRQEIEDLLLTLTLPFSR